MIIENVDFSQLFALPSPDKHLGLESYEAIKLFDLCGLPINVTIFNSWLVILLIATICFFSTRNLSAEKTPSKWQLLLEMLVTWLQSEAKEAGGSKNNKYLGMAMGLFCFIFTCNLLTFIPWFRPPTASLSTTMALATVVFMAIPYFAIKNAGIKSYFKKFIEPVPLLLPMNIFSEIFSVLAMGLRLFGNMLSGVMFASILSAFIPLIAPLAMQSLGLLTGTIQAYIFALLAIVYSSSVKEKDEVN